VQISSDVRRVGRVFILLVSALVVLSAQGMRAIDELFQAVRAGCVSDVQRLVDAGTDVNVRYSNWTLLHCAVEHGHVEVARRLISAGAYVDATDERGKTPLHRAIETGNTGIAQLLVDVGANVNARNIQGWTLLQRAALRGYTAFVRVLLNAASADFDTQGGWWGTALHIAAVYENKQIVRALLTAGADPDVCGFVHTTSLQAAACFGGRGQARTMRALLEMGASLKGLE